VPVFAGEQDVYEKLGRLLEELLEDPMLAVQFQRADTIVQYILDAPAATLTVDIRAEAEPTVVFGHCDLMPEVTMAMAADTAHRFFLGHVNVTVALARGEIRAHGPVAKILKLVPLVRPFFPRYQALLESEGRTDLVTA
jgi:hypothetical protein